MKITAKIFITRSQENGRFMLNGHDDDTVSQEELSILYKACRGQSEEQRISTFNRLVSENKLPSFIRGEENENDFVSKREVALSALNDLIQFFSEFDFMPNFRFVNTLSHMIQKSKWKEYIVNYFRLTDSPYVAEIREKINSMEFSTIIGNLRKVGAEKVTNSRLKVYFGPQGTGKTTAALKETGNLAIVCNASMLPSDLMEDFTFDDGKAAFHPSELVRCMEEGRPIVFDEINLLPFDSLRFLQGITDGKEEINYKGNNIHIRPGFEVIGTMNLMVNGVTFGLPEPLVDRCGEINEFTMGAEALLSALE